MSPKRVVLALGGVVFLSPVVLAGCGPSGSGRSASGGGSVRPSVIASTDVYGDIVRQVAGEDVDVTSIIDDPDVDPHSYEANARDQLALAHADIVIENGGGYDDFIDTMLGAVDNPDATVLNVVDLSGRTAPAGGELNEHVWYDLSSVEKLVDRLVGALSDVDEADAASFTANGDAFKQALGRLGATEASIRVDHSGEGVAITEPVPLYLLEACGLVDKTPSAFSEAIEEGTGVPAAVLRQTLDLFSDGAAELLVYNEQTTGPETEQVLDAANANDIAVVAVTETLPNDTDYLEWMADNLAAIRSALG